jgi:aspartyl-tRNA synthetase
MKFPKRSVACGEVVPSLLGQTVTVCGWIHKRRDHGGLIFIDLRDRSGLVQAVFNPELYKDLHEKAQDLNNEDVVCVTGLVIERLGGNINENLITGKIEIRAEGIVVLNKSKALPFLVSDGGKVDEELRLKYRYIDLRRKEMFQRLKLRSDVEFAMREFFFKNGFISVDTPILTKNTPEGAREFIVPSREQLGKFYALPQSPQLYKQLLMAGGIDKYYQLARCFRDEASRADRQVEFTQLDVEMSFISEDDIQSIIENMLQFIFKRVFDKSLSIPFARISYDDAFSQYGSDKPDVRFDLKIQDCTALFDGLGISFLDKVIVEGGRIGALVVNQALSRSELTRLEQKIKEYGAAGLLWMRINENIESPIAKFLPVDFKNKLTDVLKVSQGDTIILLAGKYKKTWENLGRLRLVLGEKLNIIDKEKLAFLWVTEFPLFEFDEESKKFAAMHHPFTQPLAGWEDLEKEKMKARAYDLILNGVELGGGSIRIHTQELQSQVFDMLSISKDDAKKRFGFLLEAQTLGFPPHGGIALGLDRFIMLLAHCDSIREVIAFPKTSSGYDLLMEAPTELSAHDLAEFGLENKKTKK